MSGSAAGTAALTERLGRCVHRWRWCRHSVVGPGVASRGQARSRAGRPSSATGERGPLPNRRILSRRTARQSRAQAAPPFADVRASITPPTHRFIARGAERPYASGLRLFPVGRRSPITVWRRLRRRAY